MWLKILIPCVLTFFLGIIAHAFIIPWCKDYYKSTRFAEIELLTVSNTTLEPLKGYSDKDYYYEITFFRIENKGNEATKKNDQLKIQARGEILEITPKELNQRFEVDQKDKSIGYLNIGLLERGDKIEGALHSFSNIKTDRNEAQIGFDKIGSYELTGPNIL